MFPSAIIPAAQSTQGAGAAGHIPGKAQVNGAGSAEVDGQHALAGESHGKNFYTKSGSDADTDAVSWDGSKWRIIEGAGQVMYVSAEDVAEPWMVVVWERDKGEDPVPTVT